METEGEKAIKEKKNGASEDRISEIQRQIDAIKRQQEELQMMDRQQRRFEQESRDSHMEMDDELDLKMSPNKEESSFLIEEAPKNDQPPKKVIKKVRFQDEMGNLIMDKEETTQEKPNAVGSKRFHQDTQ